MAGVLEEFGYEVVLADVYTDDTYILDVDFHASIVAGGTCDGSVILFHMPDRPSRMQTLDIMRHSLPRLQERGFSFLRLSDMFKKEEGFWGYCGSGLILRAFMAVAFCVPCA